jgi:hypothetical protein
LVFLIRLQGEHIKFNPMQKHPNITASTQGGSCSFQATPKPIQLTQYAFQRYLKQKYFHFAAGPGINVYELPCGCSVWHFASGGRYLTTQPFWP